MWSFVVENLGEIVASVWAVKEIWARKVSRKQKAIATAREIDQLAHQLNLLGVSKEIGDALALIEKEASSVPSFVAKARERLKMGDELMSARGTPGWVPSK